jgi:outer membrane protein
MTFVRPLLLTLLLVPWAHEAQAQPPLTLDDAVAEALARNPGLAAARAGAAEASARVDQARSGYFPRLSIVESWQRGNAPVFVFSSLLSARQFAAGNFAIDALNQPDAVGFFHGAVAMDQVVFDGGRTRAGVAASRQMARMADASSVEAELSVASQVAATYGRVLSLEAAHRAAESAAAAAVEDVARAERRRDAGRVTEADVLALRVHLAAMRVRSIEVSGQAAVARAELNRLRGAAVDAVFTVTEPPPAVAADRDWATLAAEAQAGRPDVARAAASVALAESGRRQARAAWWPQVATQAAYQYDGTDLSRRASAWVVGGEVRWSFATGLGDKAAGRAAVAAETRARAQLDEARAAVQVEVLNAVRNLESAEAREALARATVAQARESERIVRDRYDAGLAGVQDVLGAASAVLGAESMRMNTLTDRITARAALDRAVGRRP